MAVSVVVASVVVVAASPLEEAVAAVPAAPEAMQEDVANVLSL